MTIAAAAITISLSVRQKRFTSHSDRLLVDWTSPMVTAMLRTWSYRPWDRWWNRS
ncbi:MAG: hypothetical protein J6T05_02655 [Prevotella sp.]|nr:hypothetical protein [Prevotella sp.]